MSSRSEDRSPVVLNPPKHIYLCFGEIDEDTEYSQLWHAHDDVLWCTDPQDASDIQYILASEVETLRTELARVTAERDALIEVQRDEERLVRELDIALNGEAGAAKQASLCDIVAQLQKIQCEGLDLEKL